MRGASERASERTRKRASARMRGSERDRRSACESESRATQAARGAADRTPRATRRGGARGDGGKEGRHARLRRPCALLRALLRAAPARARTRSALERRHRAARGACPVRVRMARCAEWRGRSLASARTRATATRAAPRRTHLEDDDDDAEEEDVELRERAEDHLEEGAVPPRAHHDLQKHDHRRRADRPARRERDVLVDEVRGAEVHLGALVRVRRLLGDQRARRRGLLVELGDSGDVGGVAALLHVDIQVRAEGTRKGGGHATRGGDARSG